jgi:hypothetical protein
VLPLSKLTTFLKPKFVLNLKNDNMNDLIDVRGMSVNEYCDFVVSRAMHLRVSPFELNMEYCFERGLISDEMYEKAKWEMNARRNDSFWLERGEVVR